MGSGGRQRRGGREMAGAEREKKWDWLLFVEKKNELPKCRKKNIYIYTHYFIGLKAQETKKILGQVNLFFHNPQDYISL